MTENEEKTLVIEFARKFLLAEKRCVTLKDLEGNFCMSRSRMRQLFGSLRGLATLIGAPPSHRKSNMTDEELKRYIEGLAQDKNSCPSYQKQETVCFQECKCWISNKVNKDKAGRPIIGYKGRVQYLSRVVYTVFKGPVGKDMNILHLCDNASCFNPDHLEQGSDTDNARQCVARGRHKSGKGPKQPRHKIKGPYDKEGLFTWIKTNSNVSSRGEWLYNINIGAGGYPQIGISNKRYTLPKLILANKLNITYEEVRVAGHRFSKNLPYSGEAPQRNDVNPDHLFDITRDDNANDAKEYHKGYALTREEVKFILDEEKNTDWLKTTGEEFDMRLAKLLKVGARTIEEVRIRKTYKDWHTDDRVLIGKCAVIQLDMQGEVVAKYRSMSEAAKSVGIHAAGISNVCSGVQSSAGGFMWTKETSCGKKSFSQTSKEEELNELN